MTDQWDFRRSSEGTTSPQPDTAQPVVVKVRTRGYIPEGFSLRSRVDEYLFTAEADARAINTAEHDPDVESVSRGRLLRSQT